MKRAALLTLTILILTFPAPGQATVSSQPDLELSGAEWASLLLELEMPGTESLSYYMPELGPDPGMQGPDDMVSMASFLWAELTGSVDIVAEAREFARDWRSGGRNNGRGAGNVRQAGPDRRSRWKVVVGCRVDDKLELAARFDTRGSLFNEKNVAFELSAADVFPNEVGITTVFRDGTIMIEADKVAMNGTAMAKVVVRF